MFGAGQSCRGNKGVREDNIFCINSAKRSIMSALLKLLSVVVFFWGGGGG